jgi:transcriptional regulator with XRE-family HTH domain
MLNERLKNLRLAKGLTLQQVGDVFGISKASVSGWESGKSHPDHKKLKQLAILLDTSVEYLVTGIDASRISTTPKYRLPFRSWTTLGELSQQSSDARNVTPLNCSPGENSFATRYPATSELDWQYPGIPAGSILIVDPDQNPGPLDTVLVQLTDGKVVLAKFDQTPENKKLLVVADSFEYKPIQLDKAKILGVALEWQLSGKFK